MFNKLKYLRQLALETGSDYNLSKCELLRGKGPLNGVI